MHSPATERRGLRRPSPALVGLAIATAFIVGGGGFLTAPTAAFAADSDIVNIPDANLKTGINRTLGGGREDGQDVTVTDAALITTLNSNRIPGPLSDLTGAEALTNLTAFQMSITLQGNTYSDLSPLAGLTKLATLVLPYGQISNLTPLANLSSLKQLQLPNNKITDLSPLSGLTGLTGLALTNNQIRDVNDIPTAPGMTALQLGGNKITDVTPLANKFDKAVLNILNLSGNRITDASPLAAYGNEGGKIGTATVTSQGLNLSGNRIADFSAFSGWTRVPIGSRVNAQKVYVGPYNAGGITVALKPADATVPAASPVDAGTFDPATSLLTLNDSAAESITVTPLWTVFFSNPPIDPGDENGPVVEGTPHVGQLLTVTDRGAVFEGGVCPDGAGGGDAFQYRWLRDGAEITENRLFFQPLVDQPINPGQFMGSPGVSTEYRVSATDLGHQLSVRVSCSALGVQSTSASVAITAAVPETPLAQGLEGTSLYQAFSDSDEWYTVATSPSGVVGDPTNPVTPIFVAQLDASGRLVDPSQIQVTLNQIGRSTDGPQAAVTADDVHISGTGAVRTIAVDPEEPIAGLEVSFLVTGTTGKTSILRIYYSASVATTPTSRVLLGSSDASTAIDVGDGYLMVADDEKLAVQLYDGEVSGRSVAAFTLGDNTTGTGSSEMDAESSARKGDTIWWFGSHGNSKDGEIEGSRHAIFATTLSGTGANATLTPVGVRYGDLRRDLVDWDVNNNNRFGFRDATANHMRPDPVDGFNMEGVEFSPDGSALYLGFRAPLAPKVAGGKALIVPLTNLEGLTAGTATKATFGEPILFDLGGDSIREIRKNARNEYLILSAPGGALTSASPAPVQTLWAWNGDPDIAPQRLSTVLPIDVEPNHTDNIGAWEGIGAMPERLVPGAQVRLISDQGYDRLYSGGENKDDTDNWTNKARTDVVTLAGPAGSIASVSDPGAFPAQKANTIGAARAFTMTNTGSNVLHLGRVLTEDDDQVSADDFLISGNTCASASLDPGETCVVRLRFAPAREDATSTARLVIESDVVAGRSTVTLTGVSGEFVTGTPTIAGTPAVGEKLTVQPGEWSDGTTFGYRWLRDGVAIEGATAGEYTIVESDAETQIAVEVTGTRAGFPSAVKTSAPVTVAGAAPELDVALTATGRSVAGKVTLTASAKNNASVAVDIEIASAFGSKKFVAVAPGKSVSVSFNSRLVSIDAGEVTASVSAVVGGQPVVDEATASYPAFN